MRKPVLIVLAVILLAAGAGGGWHWWNVSRFLQSTDDAYVQSDVSLISPKIEGYIKEVRVRDNEAVTAGQVLFVVDDRDFAAKLAQAEAAIATQEASVATYATRLKLQQAMIDQAAANMRSTFLVTSDSPSRQRYESAEADSRKADAALGKARAALVAEQSQLAVLESQRREEEAKLAQARAPLQLAKNDLNNTVIRAPVAAIAGLRVGQIGQYVKPGTQLLSLVPLPRVFVTANFKETQLTHMRPGEPAEISVDDYPDQPLQGQGESFAPGSGAQFSLLPPDNATGNFTKVVQRVPVRIALPASGAAGGRLGPAR